MSLGRNHVGSRPSEELLLPAEGQGTEMTSLAISRAQEHEEVSSGTELHVNGNKSAPQVQEQYSDTPTNQRTLRPESTRGGDGDGEAQSTIPLQYRVYKRRWFGLIQLVLLNIVVSWDVRVPKSLLPAIC